MDESDAAGDYPRTRKLQHPRDLSTDAACRPGSVRHIPEQVDGGGKEGGALTEGMCGLPEGLAGLG